MSSELNNSCLKKHQKAEESVAGPTRLELATSGVTGRRSSQLNYDPTRRTRLYCIPGNLSQRGEVGR